MERCEPGQAGNGAAISMQSHVLGTPGRLSVPPTTGSF